MTYSGHLFILESVQLRNINKDVLEAYTGPLCCACSPIRLIAWLQYVLICGVLQTLFLSLVVVFNFPVAACGLDLFRGACLNKLRVLMVTRD